MSKSIETIRNDNLRVLDPMCRVGRNFCKYSRNNSDAHENLKWKVFMSLRKQGCDVITEAVFNNKSRADVYILDLDIAVEILETETLKACHAKCEKYPVNKFWMVDNDVVYFFNKLDSYPNQISKFNLKSFKEVFP